MKNNKTIKENFDFAFENHKKNNLEIAGKIYKKILEIDPNHFPSTVLLGTLSAQTKNFALAIQLLEKGIKINPNHPEAHYNLGLVFNELVDFEKAITYYEKAIEIKPNYADAYNNLGRIYTELGDFQKARNCYEQAIKFQPGNLGYFYALSYFKKEILNPNLRNSIEKIINDNNCTKRNMAYGNYLLAMCESKEKNYEKEIDYLIKAHTYYFESKKEKFSKEMKYYFDVLPNINKLISLNKSNKNHHKINPIFIIGVPRCGSTLVEKVIASGARHIPIGEETSILDIFIKQKIEKKQLLNFNKENFQMELLEAYNHKGLVQESSGYTFTDKSLENFFYISFIKEIFPNAKVVNCRRNALSSIMSIFRNNMLLLGWAHNLEYIFKYFDIYYRMVENFKKIFPNFIYELQLEKFVDNPEIESKKLLKYCNLPWDKKCLEFYKRKDFISKTASNVQIREAIYKRSLDKYLPYKKFLDKYANKYSWFN